MPALLLVLVEIDRVKDKVVNNNLLLNYSVTEQLLLIIVSIMKSLVSFPVNYTLIK